ncbi:MAG: hypothetical protein ABSE95_16265 [Thermodesulfobacteriota bacterium]
MNGLIEERNPLDQKKVKHFAGAWKTPMVNLGQWYLLRSRGFYRD